MFDPDHINAEPEPNWIERILAAVSGVFGVDPADGYYPSAASPWTRFIGCVAGITDDGRPLVEVKVG